MAGVQSELLQFMIDQDDEDCPEVGLPLAAWQGRLELVQQELELPPPLCVPPNHPCAAAAH